MRIRTVKPEFFKSEELYDLEAETGLPVRVAFAGLWCAADRDGRFKWRPRTLKTDILPHDDVDFSRVLDALATRGFVVKYACDGREYGAVTNFGKHQVVNNREKKSELPPPPETEEVTDTSTRALRVVDACPTEIDAWSESESGREGKGREQGKEGNTCARETHDSTPPVQTTRGRVAAAFAQEYEERRAMLWDVTAHSVDLDRIAEWVDSQAEREGIEPQAVGERLLGNWFQHKWGRECDFKPRQLLRCIGEVYSPPTRRPSVAPVATPEQIAEDAKLNESELRAFEEQA